MKIARTRDHVFAAALAVSLVVHLSMVTIFRIVIYFPRIDPEYIDVAIVETRTPIRPLPFTPERLDLPSAESGFERLELSDETLPKDSLWTGLPDIQLPTIQFAELDRMRFRREVLETRLRYDTLFDDRPEDTWSRFGKKLSSVSESLARFTLGAPTAEPPRPSPVSRPAPGYAAYLEWLSDPRDRQVLSIHPIDALWGLDPAEFGGPIALAFRVDRAGNVVDILDPVDDSGGIMEASVRALERYRFAPLLGDGPATQQGTLIIRAVGDGP